MSTSWPFASSSRCIALFAITIWAILGTVTTASAQANDNGQVASLNAAVFFASDAPWKTTSEYSNIVNTERTQTGVLLSDPSLDNEKRALYTGYDRMLGYIQTDLSKGASTQGLLDASFNKVVQEAPADAQLQNMRSDEFLQLRASLAKKLQQ